MRLKVGTAVLLLCALVGLTLPRHTSAQTLNVIPIATELHNPRGVAVFPDGRLLVAESGDGAGFELALEPGRGLKVKHVAG